MWSRSYILTVQLSAARPRKVSESRNHPDEIDHFGMKTGEVVRLVFIAGMVASVGLAYAQSTRRHLIRSPISGSRTVRWLFIRFHLFQSHRSLLLAGQQSTSSSIYPTANGHHIRPSLIPSHSRINITYSHLIWLTQSENAFRIWRPTVIAYSHRIQE